jgi:hypothetical protein
MKPALPPPARPDGKPFESLDELFRAVIAVPKSEIDRREEEWKQSRNQGKGEIAPNRGKGPNLDQPAKLGEKRHLPKAHQAGSRGPNLSRKTSLKKPH